MMRQASVNLYDTSGNLYTLFDPLQFVFRKERYTPYTELNITLADTGRLVPVQAVINRIQLVAERTLLHDGIIDSAALSRENGVTLITIRSKGFTSLLMNNEMTPGVHGAMSLDKLMTAYYDFPSQIQWQSDADDSNYIYVKSHSTMWESVVNLGYKLYKSYPYIRYTNLICLKPHDNAKTYVFPEGEVLSAGSRTVGSRLLSHLHMADVDGNYDTYALENSDAVAMHIVRHKQLAFDRQYLHDPVQSLNLKFALSAQGWRSCFVTCNGYQDLDLNDYVGAEGVFEPGRISAVTVTGNSTGIRTTYTVYEDAFSDI